MKRAFILIVSLGLSLYANETTFAQANASRNAKVPVSIDVNAGLKNQVPMKLSDFADSIAYISLKGLPRVPIGWVINLEMTTDNLFVLASDVTGLLRFNRKGELLNRIGKFGNGPGELSMGSDFSLSPSESRVFFQRNFTKNLLSFSYDGKFIEDLNLDKNRLSSRTIILAPNRILQLGAKVAPPEPIPPGYYEANLIDKKGTAIQKVASPLTNTPDWRSRPRANKIGFSGERSEVWYKNRYLFDAYGSDTLYEATSAGIVPRYYLNKGKFSGPKWMKDLFKSRTESYAGDFLTTQGVFESDAFLLFRGRLKESCHLIRVNKSNNTAGSMKATGIPQNAPYPSTLKIPNDLDGGISFFPEFTNREGTIWICTLSAVDYREEIKALADKGKIELRNKSNKAVALYNTLTDDDNPVVVLVYLKQKK